MFDRIRNRFRNALSASATMNAKAGEAHSPGGNAQGEVKFLPLSQVMGVSDAPDWTQFMGRTLLEEGYNKNTWVFACIRKRMQAVGSVPLVVQQRGTEGEWTESERNDPLSRLLRNPCPGMSGEQLVKMIVGQFDIQGEFFARIVRGGRGGALPLELWPLQIGTVAPIVRDNEIIRYRYTRRDGKEDTLAPEEVLHLRYTHPDSKTAGMPPILPAGKAVDVDNEASAWQKVSMQNRGVPDGVFVLKGEEVGPDEWEEARRQVREQYVGQDNAREPWVVANAEFEQMAQSMADLDFMGGRRMTREEICAALDVPPPLVGIYDNATLSNIETARKIMWRDSLLPLLSDIADQLSRSLVPPFAGNRADALDRRRVEFDVTGVAALQDSLTEKVQVAQQLRQIGIPLSEINRRLELGLEIEDIAGSDQAYSPSGLIPTGTAMAPAPAAEGEGEEEEQPEELTDEGFTRLLTLAQRVADGQLTAEAALSMASAMPGVPLEVARDVLQAAADGATVEGEE